MVRDIRLGRLDGIEEIDTTPLERQVAKEISKRITIEIEGVGRIQDMMRVIRHHCSANGIELYEGKFSMPTVSHIVDGGQVSERFPTWTQAVDRALTLLASSNGAQAG